MDNGQFRSDRFFLKNAFVPNRITIDSILYSFKMKQTGQERKLKNPFLPGFLCLPRMGSNLVVKVHYTLGSRKC